MRKIFWPLHIFSSHVTPAMKNDQDEDNSVNNIYEEILPPDKRLFYSISQGRRDNLEMYKFADWDLEEKLKQPTTDKVNKSLHKQQS